MGEPVAVLLLVALVQIPLPRKGTETVLEMGFITQLHVQIPLPRKGTETPIVLQAGHVGCGVQIPLPRKGTETSSETPTSPEHAGSNSITPQGDGNEPKTTISVRTTEAVQIPLPRKGTETIEALTDVQGFSSTYVQIPLPRKGTETL